MYAAGLPYLHRNGYSLKAQDHTEQLQIMKCSSLNVDPCRSFPSDDVYDDCSEDGFCEEWSTAKTDMIFACIIGGVTFFYLLYVLLIGGVSLKQIGWKYISALLQISTVSFIAHLYNTSDRFYYGVKFDICFMLASSSAGLNFVLACILLYVGWFSLNNSSDYSALE
ncbi:44111_t:CDS:2 [Gigaspora margarita]|uniref:44111_t:CDS:1 n=1 Tax=Gigaspora margarita TaxID=4874 RepID=A0ABN7W0W1_GIGMA|nr:44111_t:CDS:2 [Gigaspora margarita]